jgi:hypothetical protein
MGKHQSEVVAQLGLQSLQRVSGGCAEVVARRRDLTPEEFRTEDMWPNKPVSVELGLCQDWGCVMWKRSDGAPNVTYLREAAAADWRVMVLSDPCKENSSTP